MIYFVSRQPLNNIYSIIGFPWPRCGIIGYNCGHVLSTHEKMATTADNEIIITCCQNFVHANAEH